MTTAADITAADVATLNADTDPFEAAFEAFTRPHEKDAKIAPVADNPVTEGEKDTKVAASTENQLQGAAASEPITDQAAQPVVEDAAKAAPVEKVVDSSSQTDDTLRRFTEAVEKIVKPAPPPPVRQEPVEPVIYTPEEQAFLEAYDKDWANVSTGESLKRRAEYREVVKYVFDQIGAQIKPMMDTLRTLSERTHLGDLEEIAEDYDDIRDKVVDWAAKQPAYLKVAYQHVIQDGSADEVHDLISRWRAETGTAAAPLAAAPSAPSPKPAVELTAGTKKAVARLAPVIGKRTGVQAGLDPNDFDTAFETFAKRLQPGA